MNKTPYFISIFFVFFLILPISLYAHEGEVHEEPAEPEHYLPFDPFPISLYVFSFVVFISIISVIFQKSMSEPIKKIVFILVFLSVSLVTIYLAGSTAYLNVISESGGPVHWHADFEIWKCGERIDQDLKEPEGLSNKVGNEVFHHHKDFRIHIEGIVIEKKDISLGAFFRVIGGSYTGDSVTLLLNDGYYDTTINGDLCNGEPGQWRLYLLNHNTGEFEENFERDSYVIKPYGTVPPGDHIKLVFDSEEVIPE